MRRVLLLAPFPLAADGRHGGARAIRGLAGALAERHELIVVHVGPRTDVDPDLRQRCLEIISVDPPPRAPRMERLCRTAAIARGRTVWSADSRILALAQEARAAVARFRPEVVQAEYGRLGSALAAAGGLPLRVVTLHDPAVIRLTELPPVRDRATLAVGLDARAAAREERRLLSLVDAAVVFSEEDRIVVMAGTREPSKIAVVPLATNIPIQPLSPLGADPPGIAFIGNFSHPPNVDAALRLGRSIFPLVKAAHPETTLDIVGYDPPQEVRDLASESVRVTGGLPDLNELLDRAAVVAAPMATGGGSRVKVLDALAAGKPVVTTQRGAAGITAPVGEAILIAEHDRDLAAAIAALLCDPDRRERMGRRARAWAEQELAWSRMARQYDDLYARTAQRRHRVDAAREVVDRDRS